MQQRVDQIISLVDFDLNDLFVFELVNFKIKSFFSDMSFFLPENFLPPCPKNKYSFLLPPVSILDLLTIRLLFL